MGLLCVLAFFWVRAHSTGYVPPSPWSVRTEVVRTGDNANTFTANEVDTPEAFDDLLHAPVEEHARIFRENESAIDHAVRATAETRAQADARPRFVLAGGDIIDALAFSRHRGVAVLVEPESSRALVMARVFWRHALDAIAQCDTLVECMVGLAIGEHAMLSVESVLYRFSVDELPGRAELKAEVQTAFRRRPSLARAIESEYLFVRTAIEELTCVSLDRAQTEAILREYYEAMHDYAERLARVEDTASEEGIALGRAVEPFRDGVQDEFSSFYNICGGTLAETFGIGLDEHIERHRERVDELVERQRALH